ncbi:hypothetical protein COLSTE_00075 [Collinsella stercoris DSM 13279]|uniref:Uncharacterized protein n=1 Tax=Collinsella stercoris DSM 13279 TaxID=445975 RepID=B6G7N6_9ACTN|nr:hypothetical protein COLSTE_00075 [Collinsella stercoris DSM 13279]
MQAWCLLLNRRLSLIMPSKRLFSQMNLGANEVRRLHAKRRCA